jgi:NAD(P)-dependent dehydrogenase (short-subunit alcohol dehydrogenase family)
VLDIGNIRETIGEVVRDFGRLDILVNNAGIRRRQPALEVTEEDWDAVLDTNLKGVFFCAQAAARQMIPQGEGRIINIASQLAIVARPDRAAYCASKGGVANLTRVLALEWIKYGITVNAIGPGPTTTPGLQEADIRPEAEVELEMEAHMPLGRRMEPEELVGAAVYLASPSANATTGHLLIVDGGWTAL